jgi:hypothetical protein
MSTYRFDGLPSNSSVASAVVTLAVCTWFWVAGAAIIVAPHAEPAASQPSQVVYTAPAVAIAPEARLLIVVEGHRV